MDANNDLNDTKEIVGITNEVLEQSIGTGTVWAAKGVKNHINESQEKKD